MGKSLDTVKTLAPFLKQHSRMLLLGFVFVVLQNFSYMKIPMYIRLILDEIGGHRGPGFIDDGQRQIERVPVDIQSARPDHRYFSCRANREDI